MRYIVPIVEGDGEYYAVPTLLRKMLKAAKRYDVDVGVPKNAKGRGNLTRPNGLETFVRYAYKERNCGAVLVLLDAEQDCPVEIAHEFSERIKKVGAKHPVVIVCANHMYENWLMASIETICGKDLEGRPGLPAGLIGPSDADAIRSATGHIDSHFSAGRKYKKSEDQKAMTEYLDIRMAKQRSRSFRRMLHAIDEVMEAIDSGVVAVTPKFDLGTTATKDQGRPQKRKKP